MSRPNNFESDIKKDYSKTRPRIYSDDSPSTSTDDLLAKYNEATNRGTTHNEKTGKHTNSSLHKKNNKIKRFFLKLFLVFLAFLIVVTILGWLISLVLPTKTTFLIMATDLDGTRTDSIMYGVFDKSDKSISLLSIPRDTYITVDDKTYSKMKEEFPQPGSKSMKINAVHHYGGEKYGMKMIIEYVEKLTGNDVDFYAKLNFSAFRRIIDTVGGVEFYVPRDMEYTDPLQNLHISLKQGQQRLNGEQAEQLLRYRSGYANADLGRVDVQQQFIKEFISQVFSKKTILSNAFSFARIFADSKYLDTNFDIIDGIPYLFAIYGLDTDSLESTTLPGRPGYSGGQSVYFYNEVETVDIIKEMMN